MVIVNTYQYRPVTYYCRERVPLYRQTDMTSTTDTRDAPGRGERDDEAEYALLVLVDGDVLLYDRWNHRAWLQSDAPVPLSEAL